ncbi:MAG: hypothetical protein KTR31_36135 [Myxococcales bacterium]|nr:hypothetical protein [Myxococcales bacterium]
MEHVQTLLERVRQAPTDRGLRDVLADAWLEAGDIRGALAAAERDGDRAAVARAWEPCVDRLRAALPGATLLRVHRGLLTHVELPLESAAEIAPGFFATEPLATVRLALPSIETDDDDQPIFDPQGLQRLVEAAAASLVGLFGLQLTGFSPLQWPAVTWLVEQLQPRLLSLGLPVDELEKRLQPPPTWSPVWALQLQYWTSGADAPEDALLRAWLQQLDPARLALDPMSVVADVDALLQHPSLQHLDLRGVSVSSLHALTSWRDAAPGRSVRHEALDLACPSAAHDPFGDLGRVWPSATREARACAVAGDSEPRHVIARGTRLTQHRVDHPEWERSVDAAVTALAGSEAGPVWADDGGAVVVGGRNHAIPVVTLPPPVRRLQAQGDDLLAHHAAGWWIRQDGAHTDHRDPVDAVAWVGGGVALARGTAVHLPDGTVQELGAPILALASDGARLVAVTGTWLWEVASPPRLLGRRQAAGPVALAVRDDVVAWAQSNTQVRILRGTEITDAYYSGYMFGGRDLPFLVSDVAINDEGGVLVAFEHGTANLLRPEGALKLDEFEGEPQRSWLFIYQGQVLTAGF